MTGAHLSLRLTGGTDNAEMALSLGGATSSHVVASALFHDLDLSQCKAGHTDYRAVDLVNEGDQEAKGVQVWLEPAGGIFLGTGKAGGARIVKETNAPFEDGAFVNFGAYGVNTPKVLPNIPPGKAVRVWLMRLTPRKASAATANATIKWVYR